MSPRWKLFAWALAFSAAAALLWSWHGQRGEQARRRHDAWEAYLHGPLEDLLYGSSRLRALPAKPGSVGQRERSSAQEALLRSFEKARALEDGWGQDAFFESLRGSAFRHHALWSLSMGKQDERWRKDEAQSRADLASRLDSQRDKVLEARLLTKDEVLEMNALLYSLKEESPVALH